MAPKLYFSIISNPARSVMLTAKAANIELDLVEIKILEQEQYKPEFLKLNPLHTVPTLDDNGFILCDSHAIMIYLVEKYSKDRSLYPDDVEKRAIINQRLFFESGVLFARLFNTAYPILYHGVKKITEKQIQDMNEAYGYIETFLEDTTYVAGNDLSIADFCILTAITNSNVVVPLDEGKYPKISAWKKLLQALPFCDIDKVGGDVYKSLMASKLEE